MGWMGDASEELGRGIGFKEGLKEAEKAVKWVKNDIAYKAPEQRYSVEHACDLILGWLERKKKDGPDE